MNSIKQDNLSQYHYINSWNPTIYKVESPDAIEPEGKDASVLFRYFGDNKSAGVWYKGKYQSVVLTVPIETIATDAERNALIKQLLQLMELKKQ